jgi:hypothetical protein
MTKKPNTRPHPPTTSARQAGRVATTHRPRPFYKKGGRLVVCPRVQGDCESKEKPGGWIPAWAALPSTIEEIEAGRGDGQRELFGRDNSREAKVERLCVLPGVVRGDRLTAPPSKVLCGTPHL